MKVLDYEGLQYYDGTLYDKYLPKSGGRMSGNIEYMNDNSQTFFIGFSSPTKDNIDVGWRYSDGLGGGIGLRSISYPAPYAGAFNLYAKNGNVVKTLVGRTDGVLTWDGTAISLDGHTHNYLPLTGGTLSGNEIIYKSAPRIILRDSAIARGTAPSANYSQVEVTGVDKNNANTWGLYHRYNKDKLHRIDLICYKGTTTDSTWTGIGVGYNASGDWFTYAPTPATSDNTTRIATTAYVKSCVPKSVGSATQPVYTDSNGVIKKCTYTLGKSVPANAVFTDTDTTYSKGSVALLTAGTDTEGRVWAASTLASAFGGNKSATANGYVELAGGLKIQWGSFTSAENTTKQVTFPTPFSSACYSCVCSGNTNEETNVQFVSATTTKATFRTGYVNTVKWIAIGK